MEKSETAAAGIWREIDERTHHALSLTSTILKSCGDRFFYLDESPESVREASQQSLVDGLCDKNQICIGEIDRLKLQVDNLLRIAKSVVYLSESGTDGEKWALRGIVDDVNKILRWIQLNDSNNEQKEME